MTEEDPAGRERDRARDAPDAGLMAGMDFPGYRDLLANGDHEPSLADGNGPEGPECPCAGGDGSWRPADERGTVERRDYAKVLATMGGLAAVGSLSAPLAGLTRVFEREYTGPIFSDGVHLVDAEGDRISTDRLTPGELMTVFPETHPGVDDAPTLLVRFDSDQYAGGTRAEWVAQGYAAYSKVCTHAGCMVSEREDTTLVCPCHAGKFDPLSGASVVGGPPPRALPQLPLTVSEDGLLVATGDFGGPIGPGGE